VSDETGQGDASNHRMLQALAESRFCAMEVSTREIFFERRGAGGHAIEFHGSARRIAGDFQGLG